MGTQNLNNFYFNKLDSKINYSEYYDLFLASDEKDFNTDVVWSSGITASDDGDILPVWIDLNDTSCSTQPTTTCAFQYPTGMTPSYPWNTGYTPFVILSKNYWPKAKTTCGCPWENYGWTGDTVDFFELCDAMWTSLDNGLYNEEMFQDGACLYLFDTLPGVTSPWGDLTFDQFSYDKRFKMHQIKAFGYPITGGSLNEWYTDTSILDKGDYSGYYQDLRGGFYQGFYKLYGYPYEVLPTRPNKGWSFETYLKLNTITTSICSGITSSCCDTPVGDQVILCGYNGNCYNASGWNWWQYNSTATTYNFGSATTICSPLSTNEIPGHLLNYSVAGLSGITVMDSNNSGFFFYKGVRAEDKYQNRGRIILRYPIGHFISLYNIKWWICLQCQE